MPSSTPVFDPDIGLGVLARVVAAAVAVVGLEVVVGIAHVPEAAAVAEQRVPDAAHLRHHVVHAAVGAILDVGGRVGGVVAATVRFHLVADHAFHAEGNVGGGVVELAVVGRRVLARVARRVVDQRVAGVRVVVAQPGHGLHGVCVGGVGARAGGVPVGHVDGVEIGVRAVREVVLELVGRPGGGGQRRAGEDAHVHVVMGGHVPLERREDQLVGVAAGRLQLLHGRNLHARHGLRERLRAAHQRGAVLVEARQAQVVRDRRPVEVVAG